MTTHLQGTLGFSGGSARRQLFRYGGLVGSCGSNQKTQFFKPPTCRLPLGKERILKRGRARLGVLEGCPSGTSSVFLNQEMRALEVRGRESRFLGYFGAKKTAN